MMKINNLFIKKFNIYNNNLANVQFKQLYFLIKKLKFVI